MQTQKEYRDAKHEKLQQARLIQELTDHDGYKLLMDDLKQVTDDARESIIISKTHEEFLVKRARWNGLRELSKMVDTYINRGKAAERTLKK